MKKIWIYVGKDQAKEYHLYGIRGWLLFFYISNCLNVVLILVGWSTAIREFNLSGWEVLKTSPAQTCLLISWPFYLLLISYLFSTKHFKTRPILIIGTLILSVISIAFIISIEIELYELGIKPTSNILSDILSLLISTLVWVLYFTYSKRVRLTFEHKIRVKIPTWFEPHGYQLKDDANKAIPYQMFPPISSEFSKNWYMLVAVSAFLLMFFLFRLYDINGSQQKLSSLLKIKDNYVAAQHNSQQPTTEPAINFKKITPVLDEKIEQIKQENTLLTTTEPQATTVMNEAPTPKFSDYPAQKTHHGKNAPVKLVSEFDRNFRTRIRATENMEANFAGNHVISTWGCGTMCTMGVAVNTQTGNVTSLPGTICCWWGEGENIIFRPDSRLIVLAGRINEGDIYGAHFYELKDNQFIHIQTTVLPEND